MQDFIQDFLGEGEKLSIQPLTCRSKVAAEVLFQHMGLSTCGS